MNYEDDLAGNGLAGLFRPGGQLETYRGEEDLQEKAADYLARMGFDACDPRDSARWLSEEYAEEMRRFGAALHELLSPERIARRHLRIITEVVARGASPPRTDRLADPRGSSYLSEVAMATSCQWTPRRSTPSSRAHGPRRHLAGVNEDTIARLGSVQMRFIAASI